MPVIRVSKADLLLAKNIEAGWTTCLIPSTGGFRYEASKSKKSNNLWVTLQLAEGPLQGKEVSFLINDESNASSVLGTLTMMPQGRLAEVYAAVKKVSQPGDEIEIDTDDLTDQKLDVNFGVAIDKESGTPFNTVLGFAPEGAGKNQKTPF